MTFGSAVVDWLVGVLQQVLGFAFEFEPGILMRLRARQRRDPLYEVEEALRWTAFLFQD